jgi:hypothetical protein
MEKIVSKKARQLDRILQDIHKYVTIKDQLNLQAVLQLYFVSQLNVKIILLYIKI